MDSLSPVVPYFLLSAVDPMLFGSVGSKDALIDRVESLQ